MYSNIKSCLHAYFNLVKYVNIIILHMADGKTEAERVSRNKI